MRSEQNWRTLVYDQVVSSFTPRLRADIKDIPYELDKIPEFGSYYIYGKASSGKTLMAAHMYIQARKKQYLEALPGKFLFVNAYDLFLELKGSFDSEDGDIPILKKYCSSPYLVLDDIGSTKFTDWQISMLQIIINYRYEELLPTVLTSNLSLDELGQAMRDDRVPSRIERMCEILEKE